MPVPLNMMSCPNLAVPIEVMLHVASVESARNPFAIGVVGAHLERQPENLSEALATVHMLENRGYNFSLGVAQVNRYNLAKYGLTDYELAFNACANLSAGARILSECHALAGGDWGKSFSCYYSGNLTKGFEDGYVQKVFDSMRNATPDLFSSSRATKTSATQVAPNVERMQGTKPSGMNTSQLRAHLRSSAFDGADRAMVTHVARKIERAAQVADVLLPQLAGSDAPSSHDPDAHVNEQDAFVPSVRKVDANASEKPDPPTTNPAKDRADLRLGTRDQAFVF